MYGSSRLGVEEPKVAWKYKEGFGSGLFQNPFRNDSYILQAVAIGSPPSVLNVYYNLHLEGHKRYEISNHLGNVMAVITDRKRGFKIPASGIQYAYYRPAVLSATDYYAFGMEMPGRAYSAGAYRYGFNTQEKSPEIGIGHYTAMYWEYDSRIGRRWNQDPVPFAEESPYATNRNNPIDNDDPDGDCPTCITAAIGGVVGGLFGGGIEIATQLYKGGKVSDWTAVGGRAAQGAVTGVAAGFTGGASFLVTASVAGGANAVGGALNNTIQGKPVTVSSVATDATVGAVFGVAGKYIGGKIAAAQKTGKAASASSVPSKSAKVLSKSEMTKVKGGAGGGQNPKGGVYSFRDPQNIAKRTGRTKDLAKRESQHARVLDDEGLTFKIEHKTDIYAQQRGLEHVIQKDNPSSDLINGGLNKIKAISDKNPNKNTYIEAASDFLQNKPK